MPEQGPAPLLNRAWSRRGWASPPPFGRSVTGLMAETTITITRAATVPNDIGGFKRGAVTTVYAGPAHVERVEDVRPASTEAEPALGVVTFVHYDIYMDMPPDPAQVPLSEDRVRFSDGLAIHDLPIMSVTLGSGLLDHLELRTDEFRS